MQDLAAEHVRVGRRCGVNAHLKVPCLAAGMIAGADSIDDMGLLRHGALERDDAGQTVGCCCVRDVRSVRCWVKVR